MTEQNQSYDLVPEPQATINLPALIDREDALAVIQENLEGIEGGLKFDKVKIPTGGGISFEVINDAGEPDPAKELKGVVLDFYGIKAWWAAAFTGDKNPPSCSSMDCKTGSGSPENGIPAGQLCATCPKNQWGSDPKGGRGKACKDMYRIYLLQEGQAFPVLLALPPTSLNSWEKYVQRLTSKLKPYYGVVTVAKLEKDKNADGVEYSRVAFSKAADLTVAERKTIKEYAAPMKSAMRTQAIDSTEYNTDHAPAQDTEEEGY